MESTRSTEENKQKYTIENHYSRKVGRLFRKTLRRNVSAGSIEYGTRRYNRRAIQNYHRRTSKKRHTKVKKHQSKTKSTMNKLIRWSTCSSRIHSVIQNTKRGTHSGQTEIYYLLFPCSRKETRQTPRNYRRIT